MADNNRDFISLVAPMYNEEGNVEAFYKACRSILDDQGVLWEMICVNDGSEDATLERLLEIHDRDERVKIVDLSRNFGKEIALSCGISRSSGSAVISLDADMQHTPEIIPSLLDRWHEGYEVVFAVPRTRDYESHMKRFFTRCFYSLLGWISKVPNQHRIGDFCLLDRKVVKVLNSLPEQNRFMKGLFSWVGFRQGFVMYDPGDRLSGRTKWNYWKLWNFAIQGITSFSDVPLRIWTYIGFLISSLCLLYASFIVGRTLILGIDVPGYASLLVSILFMGGIQLISLGVIGEYIGRIHMEVKGRPLFIAKGVYGFGEKDGEEVQDSRTNNGIKR